MEDFSKEDFTFINKLLIKLGDQSETAGFDMEKLMLDSYGSSDMKYYDYLLRKVENSIKNHRCT